ASARPRYVLAVLPASGTVVVGGADDLDAAGLVARDVSWLSIEPPRAELRAEVKIRHRAADAPARLSPRADGRIEGVFDRPQRAVTPGQAAVFYQGEVCLGGGWIAAAPGPQARRPPRTP